MLKRTIQLTVVGIIITILVVWGVASEASGAEEEEMIAPGHSVSDILSFAPETGWYKTYRIEVPPEAFGIRLTLDGASADLDLFVNHGEDMTSYEEASASSTLPDYNESLFLSRRHNPPLETGFYYVDVAYQGDLPPRRNGRILGETPFTLTYEVILPRTANSLTPDERLTSTLLPEEGMMKIFTIEVPRGTKALRVDLFDTLGDLDLLINRGQRALHLGEADFLGDWAMGRETVILRDLPGEPLDPDLYYVTVLDQINEDAPEDFSIIARLSEKPANFLMELPFLSIPKDPLERVLLATLEIISEGGTGSGSLVSKGGLVLTNWHVIQSAGGGPEENIYGAVNLNQERPPVEAFRLEVVDYDETRDIALLRVTQGFYGQPLPFDYRFPYYKLGGDDPLMMGQSLIVIGYPINGGIGSRPTISVTRGIVSGFEKTPYGTIIKTDAQLNSGNSGGAAINTSYELIGIPTAFISGGTGQMGFIHPISLLPSEWVRMIEND